MPQAAAPLPFLLSGATSLAPVLLTCEHASWRLPPAAGPQPAFAALLRSHWGFDAGAWALARAVARALNATAVGGRWTRLWVDLNRRVDEPELIRPSAGGIELPWNRALPAAAVEQRVVAVHAAYHQEVDRLLARRLLRGIRPLLLAVHSFTPRLGQSVRRFDAGVLYVAHRAAARRLAAALRHAGFAVRYNEPYSGPQGLMYSAERHGTHLGLRSLELEVNQALLAQPDRTARLVAAVADALRREADLA